jgi:hypothetical protein
MKPGDKIRVPYGTEWREVTVARVSNVAVEVLVDFGDGEPIPGLYRLSEIEGRES